MLFCFVFVYGTYDSFNVSALNCSHFLHSSCEHVWICLFPESISLGTDFFLETSQSQSRSDYVAASLGHLTRYTSKNSIREKKKVMTCQYRAVLAIKYPSSEALK